MAANGFAIEREDIDDFHKSWVAEQKVCYITEDEDHKTIVHLNFPTLPLYLKDDIHSMVKAKKIDISQYYEVQGFIMEETFCQYFVEPRILTVHIEHTCISLSVNECKAGEVKMITNVLYHLRQYHPALDFIGKLTD